MHSAIIVLIAAATGGCGSSSDAPAIQASPKNDGGSVTASGQPAVPGSNTPPATGSTAKPPAPVGCVTDVAAGHHAFVCDGMRYDVEISTQCAQGGCGLVLDVPGIGMDASQQDKSTGLRARGAARGYVVVQPTPPSGLLGPEIVPLRDDEKVWKFVTDVRGALSIDSRRVHVTGFAEGGAMAFRFLFKHSDEIASAAPVSKVDDCYFTGVDTPARAVPILTMHGLRDPLVPTFQWRAQRDRMLHWLGTSTGTVVSEDTGHQRTRYSNGGSGSVVETIEHNYVVPDAELTVVGPGAVGGHCVPGSDDLTRSVERSVIFGCNPPNAFVWGDVVMDFFASHVMP